MLDKNFVNKKISLIKDYLQELEGIIRLDQKEIIGDVKNLRMLERELQLIVDEILDINLYFIKELELKSPADFQSTFEILANAEILPVEFAIKIAPVVGLRNKIVHRYEEIDNRRLVEQVQKEYQDFVDYLKYISRYLEKSA